MERVQPRTLSGFMELPPREQVIFDAMSARIREAFSLYGFTPLDTPVIEASEVLLAKAGGETEKQIYRFMKGETDLSLRFDLTVPLAKYVAANCGKLIFPFRRYQIGKVYRGERAQRGRFREFYQADIDIIGDGELDLLCDAEIPGVIYKCFTSLGLERFVIRVNNRKVLGGFFALLGLGDNAAEIMRAVDRLDKIGADKVQSLLAEELGVAPGAARELVSLITAKARGEDPLTALERYLGRNEQFDAGVAELRAVARHLSDFGVPDTHFEIDLSIARGLDYYTGTVYETALRDHPEIGSVCSGGRYDNLAEHYTARRLPGVGISIGLTRLFYILQEQGYLNRKLLTAPADVMVLPMTQELSHAAALATFMRAEGLRVLIASENKKFGAKITRADKLGIPFVAFLGEDEISAGRVTAKELRTGEQVTASRVLIVNGIKEKLRALRAQLPVSEPEK